MNARKPLEADLSTEDTTCQRLLEALPDEALEPTAEGITNAVSAE